MEAGCGKHDPTTRSSVGLIRSSNPNVGSGRSCPSSGGLYWEDDEPRLTRRAIKDDEVVIAQQCATDNGDQRLNLGSLV
ncbi:hypothetical protein E2562_035968 [Oryza meyeriana var. granulata]|uniref:Uncharacterized protein n=1 Tax=Oryza meyeriana var. granulata TaxID=110450 RepID=A0A6G1ESX2_9ORYZ|nr:hypothetical protein E2562_035968 [Oryza meyeriana var. granulata]